MGDKQNKEASEILERFHEASQGHEAADVILALNYMTAYVMSMAIDVDAARALFMRTLDKLLADLAEKEKNGDFDGEDGKDSPVFNN